MKLQPLYLLLVLIINISACKNDDDNDDDTQMEETCETLQIADTSQVMGYGILEKLPGIWNGPVSSPTPLGSFPEWIVDFRPISNSQVSAKNELDNLNDIFMSFFVIKDGCDFKMAFRNGGGFAGLQRNSYMFIDSVYESSSLSFYRFVDPISGGNRVYTDVTFKQDSLIKHTFTNKYNTLAEPQTHMRWKASLRDQSSTQDALNHFDFPKKEMSRDFSTTFEGLQEAVFYSPADDPYPEEEQPYLGNSTVNVSISNPSSPDSSKKVIVIITTQPLFNGFVFQSQNLKYRSRYVLVKAKTSSSFNFNYMHPGTYYVNAIYDSNGDINATSGDYVNSNFDRTFTLSAEGNASVDVNIDFQIP